MSRRTVIAVSVFALGALALLLTSVIPPGSPTSRDAATHQTVKGQLLHLTQARDCSMTPGDPTCTPEIKAFARSERGELIEGRLFGTDQAVPTQGYAVWTYPDGSTLVARADDANKINRAGHSTAVGSQTCIFGTGRFADVDCTIDWTHTANTNGIFPGTFDVSIAPKAQS